MSNNNIIIITVTGVLCVVRYLNQTGQVSFRTEQDDVLLDNFCSRQTHSMEFHGNGRLPLSVNVGDKLMPRCPSCH